MRKEDKAGEIARELWAWAWARVNNSSQGPLVATSQAPQDGPAIGHFTRVIRAYGTARVRTRRRS